MKYIDADLLREEIERHLERATAEQEKFPDMPKYRWYLREGKKELCNDLLDYMYDALGVKEPITDSLQQGQQDVDLEKEIEEYWVATGWSKVITLGKFKVIARYFYGLGQLNSK